MSFPAFDLNKPVETTQEFLFCFLFFFLSHIRSRPFHSLTSTFHVAQKTRFFFFFFLFFKRTWSFSVARSDFVRGNDVFSPFFSPTRPRDLSRSSLSVAHAPFQCQARPLRQFQGVRLVDDVSPNLVRSRRISQKLGRSRPIRLGLARRSCQVTTYADNVLCVCLRVRSCRSVGMTSASAARHHDPAGTASEVGRRPQND